MSLYNYFFLSLVLHFLPYSSAGGPGKTACLLYGNQDKDCNEPLVPLDKLPTQCTSFFYEGFTIDPQDGIVTRFENEDSFGITKRCLKETQKPFFVYVGYDDYKTWNDNLDLDCKTAQKDADFLQKFLKENGNQIDGIVLDYLSENITARPEVQFSSKFKNYISVLKEKLKPVQIGVDLNAKSLIKFSDPPMLDFSCFDSLVDFYSVNFADFNPCNKDTCDGNIPLEKIGNLYSMDDLEKKVFPKMGVSKEKVFLNIFLNTDIFKKYSEFICKTTYQAICKNPDSAKTVCAASSCTLQKKGKFVSQYGGFIGTYVDIDDPDGCCECGKAFPAFNYVLEGFNGNVNCHPCKLFDRT